MISFSSTRWLIYRGDCKKNGEPNLICGSPQNIFLALQLERDFESQLQLPRGKGACNRSEGSITHIGVDATQIGMVEEIDEVKTEL